jgi:hypothetical protein
MTARKSALESNLVILLWVKNDFLVEKRGSRVDCGNGRSRSGCAMLVELALGFQLVWDSVPSEKTCEHTLCNCKFSCWNTAVSPPFYRTLLN